MLSICAICTPLDAGGGGPTIVVAAVGPADRLALERLVGCKVVQRQRAAVRADMIGDALPEGAAMEAAGPSSAMRRSVIA